MLRRRRPEGEAGEAPEGRPASTPTSRVAATANAAALSPAAAFALLAAARLISAALNIIHDCDETYNYLEPLHFVLYGSGMQTWEYGAQFALRAYIYLLLHAVPAAPALLLGTGRGKLVAFFLIKAALGLASAATEAWLYRAIAQRYRPALAHCFLLFLCVASGMFASSTSMLPSSFTMYALTAAAAGMLEGSPYRVIAAAAIGVVWGWCVAGFAFLPYALWVLAAAPLFRAVGVLLLCLLGTLGPLALVDRHFYGCWTASLWNFIQYNVVGGGDSALYGVEGPAYYLRNGLNNFQLLLPLALALPLLAAAAGGDALRGGKGGGAKARSGGGGVLRLLLCVSPLYVWLGAITALPHKEERFLYVAYPLVCLAAAASCTALWSLGRRLLGALLPQRASAPLAWAGAALLLASTCLLALSRSAALVVNYGAPMRIYTRLPEVAGHGPLVPVCTGAEWYRFPSAFHLPGERYRLQFINSGFTGLLPRQFDASQGGTRAAPRQFNDRNREEPDNYWPSAANCSYVVTLRDRASGSLIDELGDLAAWEEVAALPFLDAAHSPALTRAFYIPGLSPAKNRQMDYVLLRRKGAQ
ncbi:hypothetical protein ABPG75_001102 [Micractinium tetrahymenae]